MNKESQDLLLFTAAYPYGTGEVFLANELLALSSCFKRIYIFPAVRQPGDPRELPSNVEVVNWEEEASLHPFKYLLSSLMVCLEEGVRTTSKKYFWSRFLFFLKTMVTFHRNAERIASFIRRKSLQGSIGYSYWMNSWATCCAILKKIEVIKRFYFRVHGFDLYEFNRPGGYIPFRYFNTSYADGVLPVSRDGEKYFIERTGAVDKTVCSYLGVFNNGINPFDPAGPLIVVTCSSLNINKRLLLLMDVLKRTSAKIKWIHFGGKGDLTLDQVKAAAASLPPNVSAEFRGTVNNAELMSFYRSIPVHLFANMSTTEGLPVSLMEACSFGIPMLATDVGGVREIVCNRTGMLIPKDFDVNQVASFIDNFSSSPFNTAAFREGVRKFWAERFNAEKNYKDLCATLKGSSERSGKENGAYN